MKKRGARGLIISIVLLAVATYVALFGVSFGVKEILPFAQQVKNNKLGLDLTGGFYAVYEASSEGVEDFEDKLQSTINIFRTRLDARGMTEATVTQQGATGIRVEIPSSEDDPTVLSEYLATPAKLEWKDSDGNVVLQGEDIQSASADYVDGQYIVSFTLTSTGTTKFAEATAANLNKSISIYVDDELISSPTVNAVIANGSGYIEGSFTRESATQLASQIESGAIPLALTETEVQSISATLGADALEKGTLAGIVGVALVMLFMVAVYRLPGLMADIALLFYILLVFFCILTMPGVQLTLPGIAGVILSIGMAVDANVIIFERMKEELQSGKSFHTAVENSFKKAFSAILDSNITTLIAAFVLMAFGTGSIKGFAYTLAIGIGASMVSAVFVTRFFMRRLVMLDIKNPKWIAKV